MPTSATATPLPRPRTPETPRARTAAPCRTSATPPRRIARRPIWSCRSEPAALTLTTATARPPAPADHEAAVGKLEGDQLGSLHHGSGGEVRRLRRRTYTPERGFRNTG